MENEEKDYLRLTPEEFRQLENWELQQALQLMAGHMAVAEADMREDAPSHYRYLAAKERFGFIKSMATTLQTLLRSS